MKFFRVRIRDLIDLKEILKKERERHKEIKETFETISQDVDVFPVVRGVTCSATEDVNEYLNTLTVLQCFLNDIMRGLPSSDKLEMEDVFGFEIKWKKLKTDEAKVRWMKKMNP